MTDARAKDITSEKEYIVINPESSDMLNGEFDLGKMEFRLSHLSKETLPENAVILVNNHLPTSKIMCMKVIQINPN